MGRALNLCDLPLTLNQFLDGWIEAGESTLKGRAGWRKGQDFCILIQLHRASSNARAVSVLGESVPEGRFFTYICKEPTGNGGT